MTEFEANITKLKDLVEAAKTILVIQPEKPDGDSLCTALALEQLLGDLGKEVILYAKDPVPNYLSYFEGADRLTDEFPASFHFTILVDAGGASQIDRTLEKYQAKLVAKPFVIIDHHTVREALPFPTIDIIDSSAAATGELLTRIAHQLEWSINPDAANLLAPAILSDTLGLTTSNTTATTVETIATLIHAGASLHNLNERRLGASALTADLLKLRANLLLEAKFELDGQLVILMVDAETLKTYAKAYDPAALVFYDLLNVQGVKLVAVIKDYGTKVKLSMRAKAPVAARIAEQFGGGGHPQAAAAGAEAGQAEAVRAKVIELTAEYLHDAPQ